MKWLLLIPILWFLLAHWSTAMRNQPLITDGTPNGRVIVNVGNRLIGAVYALVVAILLAILLVL